MKILAITSCPLGIVCTNLAREALEQAAKKTNVDIKVETQGEFKENEITKYDIEEASAIILTSDGPIEGKERFKDLPIVYASCKDIMQNSLNIIKNIKIKYKNKI
ncbi:PTS fructose transporter subunit IIB [Anaerosalibacter massiliensis]|uniref:Fructose PTS transporter subunit IIB n=1 Tax=Anaerosalibacter massiliensis TaxID=1347392 RepID=A0A9X2MGR6_9FIRM|nr:PTS fructose transporter subunit IIB [Anaerosalibacter massiliensis]MCR2043339.1 fructose PTS transporter subunit IIB [Anaerosalibacter massiliensis]